MCPHVDINNKHHSVMRCHNPLAHLQLPLLSTMLKATYEELEANNAKLRAIIASLQKKIMMEDDITSEEDLTTVKRWKVDDAKAQHRSHSIHTFTD